MEILVGTNSPIKHRVFWKGEPGQADSLPIAKVYDVTNDPAIAPSINPLVSLVTLTSEESPTDMGVYNIYLPISLTNRNREFNIIWEYSVEGTSVSKEHRIFVTTPYVDISQAADELGLGFDYSDPNNRTYAEIVAAERYARKLIENYTGQVFYLYDDVATIYGQGTDILPLTYRLQELHELYANDILLVDNINNINNWGYDPIISASGHGIRVDKTNLLDNTVYVANGLIPPSINSYSNGIFNKDSVYRVAGKFGWNKAPDEVELATIELMRDYFSKDKVWKNKYIKQIQTFDWQFEYDGSVFKGTGNNYADQLLLPYVLNTMVVI